MTAQSVAVDITPLLATRTGVAVFVSRLLEAMAQRGDLTLTGYALSWRGRAGMARGLPPGVRIARRRMPARAMRQTWLRADWPPIELWTGAIDVVHGTNFVVPPARGAAEVVTVHDLTPLRYPELVEPASLDYPRLVRRALGRGAYVHTPSAFVADEVVDLLGADRSRVRVVHHGVPDVDAFASDGDSVDDQPYPYVLALGTVEPRKDLPTLVRAFDAVAADEPDLRLVVAGPDGWGIDAYDRAVASAHHRDRVVRVGYVADAMRGALLRRASVFAYPSLYEGFGFPPLEAMACGVPVVATTAGSLPEVLGDAARLVAPGDADAFAEAIAAVVRSDATRRDLIERGRARVVGYSWERAAAGMVDLYRAARAA